MDVIHRALMQDQADPRASGKCLIEPFDLRGESIFFFRGKVRMRPNAGLLSA